MAKLTVEELHSLRAREEAKMKKRDIEGRKRHIVVAMGTSGIENGAKIILDEIVDLAEKKGLDEFITDVYILLLISASGEGQVSKKYILGLYSRIFSQNIFSSF